jgi:hypothetical protein
MNGRQRSMVSAAPAEKQVQLVIERLQQLNPRFNGIAKNKIVDGVIEEWSMTTDQITDIVGFAVDPLGMHYDPLAVNEGTSDYWAATTQGDPHVGESLEGLDGLGRSAALRDLDGALRCPNDLIGEGHFDGRTARSGDRHHGQHQCGPAGLHVHCADDGAVSRRHVQHYLILR